MSLHEQHMNLVHQPAEYNHFHGLRILVPSEVYHPHEWSSTRLILQALPNVHGLNVLEVGGGSGALALWIKQRGAKNVVATDISEKACAAMECNAMVTEALPLILQDVYEIESGRWITSAEVTKGDVSLSDFEARLQNLLPDHGISVQKEAFL